MPWSEWMQEAYYLFPSDILVLRGAIDEAATPNPNSGDVWAWDPDAEDGDRGFVNALSVHLDDPVQYLNWRQFSPLGYDTYRPLRGGKYWPNILFSLTEDEDFAARPDVAPDAIDKWVQYETTPNDLLGWRITTRSILASDVGGTHFNWEAIVAQDTTFAAGDTIDDWPTGISFASGDETTAVPGLIPSPIALLPGAGDTSTFTIGVRYLIDGIDWADDDTGTIHLDLSVTPQYRVQPPRFRYWIPGGILPLRQYPRNDGLKGGAPAAKPTSRQGSTARRTYL